jgi:hypothetical protein
MTAARDQPHAVAVCRQVFQLQAAVIGEKRSQAKNEIEGLKAPESAASRRVGVVRDEPLPCWSRRVLSGVPAF